MARANLMASGFHWVTSVPMKLPNIKASKDEKKRDEESVSSRTSQRKDDREIAKPKSMQHARERENTTGPDPDAHRLTLMIASAVVRVLFFSAIFRDMINLGPMVILAVYAF